MGAEQSTQAGGAPGIDFLCASARKKPPKLEHTPPVVVPATTLPSEFLAPLPPPIARPPEVEVLKVTASRPPDAAALAAAAAAAAAAEPLGSPQTLTKAALSVYQGSALEAQIPGLPDQYKDLEDSQLIQFLTLQLQREPSADSCHLIMNVAQLLARSAANQPSMLPVLPVILANLRRHIDHAPLQECGIGLLGNLACAPARPPLLLQYVVRGCVLHAMAAVQAHADNAGLHRNAYRLLRNLCAQPHAVNEACVAWLMAHRVPHVVCFMLHRHIEHATLQQQALSCLWSFACCPLLAPVLASIGAADAVLRVMATHPDDAAVQRAGCGTLVQLLDAIPNTDHSPRASPAPSLPGGDEAPAAAPAAAGAAAVGRKGRNHVPPPSELAPCLLASLQRHPSDGSVVALSLEAFALLVCSPRLPAVSAHDAQLALQLAVAAVAHLPDSAEVAQRTCLLFDACLEPPASAVSETLTALPLLLGSLNAHGGHLGLNQAMCFLLQDLCQHTRSYDELLRAGVLPAAIAIARQWIGDNEVRAASRGAAAQPRLPEPPPAPPSPPSPPPPTSRCSRRLSRCSAASRRSPPTASTTSSAPRAPTS